jgi:hypothetical protein
MIQAAMHLKRCIEGMKRAHYGEVASSCTVPAEWTAIKFNIGRARALKSVRRVSFFRLMFSEMQRRVL